MVKSTLFFSPDNVNSPLKYIKDGSKSMGQLRVKGSNDFEFLIFKLNKGSHNISVTQASFGVLTIHGPGWHFRSGNCLDQSKIKPDSLHSSFFARNISQNTSTVEVCHRVPAWLQ